MLGNVSDTVTVSVTKTKTKTKTSYTQGACLCWAGITKAIIKSNHYYEEESAVHS